MGELATYVQRQRTRGWRKPDGAVSCVRPWRPVGNGRFANPIKVGDLYVDLNASGVPAPGISYERGRVKNAAEAVAIYRRWLKRSTNTQDQVLGELSGKVLMCWCAPGAVCHIQDVLIPLVNDGVRP